MNKKKLAFILATSLALGCFPAMAQQGNNKTTDAIDPQEINKKNMPIVTPGDLVEQSFEAFKKREGIEFGATGNGGNIYYKATHMVAIKKTANGWGKARVLAFDAAYLETQKKFAVDIYGRKIVEKYQSVFQDLSDGAEEFKEIDQSRTKLASIWNKLMALTGAKLDKALERLGVDPEEFKAMPPKQKKTTFSSKMTENILTNAIGDSKGLIPIQTFEGNDNKGNSTIGVITMYSPKLKQLAYNIANKRTPVLTSKGSALSEQIPDSNEELSNMFGVRVMFNEKGQACVVSFGQWSSTGKSVKEIENNRKHARATASGSADAGIAMFINGKIMFESKITKGELSEASVVKNSDGFISREEVTKIVDKMSHKLKLVSKINLAGVITTKSWKLPTPHGEELIGVVRVWTLGNTKIVNNVRNHDFNMKRNKPVTKEIKTRPEVKRGSRINFHSF